MGEKEELERLRRLREQQITARDPIEAEKRRYKILTSPHQRSTFSWSEEIKNLPARYTWILWGALIGFLLGLLIGYTLQRVFSVNWTEYVVLITIIVGGIIGRILGQARDWGRGGWGRGDK